MKTNRLRIRTRDHFIRAMTFLKMMDKPLNFINYDLRDLDLSGCNFRNSLLCMTILNRCILNGTDLRNVDLCYANILDTDLGGAIIDDGTYFKKCYYTKNTIFPKNFNSIDHYHHDKWLVS